MINIISIILVAIATIFNSLTISEIKENKLGAPSQNLLNVATSTITSIFADGKSTSTVSSASSTIAGTLNVIGLTHLYGGLNASSTATSTLSNGIQLYSGCFRDIGGSCIVGGLSAAITSLGGLTGATQTFSSNDLLTITSAGTNHHFNASTSPYFGGITATGTIAFTNLSSGLTANNNGTLYGNSTSSASCSGSVSCSAFTVVGSVSPTITSSASLFAWTPRIDGNATTTRVLLDNGFISSASSTISNSLQIAGLLQASSSLSVGGGTALDSTLSVTGTSTLAGLSAGFGTFSSNLVTSGSLSAANLATLSGGLLSTASSTINATLNLEPATVILHTYPAFGYATSSSWTSSTTRQLGVASVAETWNYAICYTTVGTLNISFSDGTNLMNMISASATPARFALTANNTFTKDEKRQVAIGTPASNPVEVSCVIDKIVNL